MKISVITVSFNSEETIKDTIRSVYKQDYHDIEYIAVDGKSSDNTVNIIKHYESLFKESKKQFRWVSEKDGGIYDAMNKGIGMVTGDVVGILNSDDYFYDNMVLSDIATQFKKRNIDCLYGDLIYVEPQTKKVTRKWKSKKYRVGLFEKSWAPAHPTFYCKKDIYEELGLYRTDFKIAADVELMYRYIEKHKIKSYYFDRFMVVMRQGGVSNRGLKSTYIATREMQKAFQDNGEKLNLVKYLFFKSLKVRQYFLKGGAHNIE